ncbi:uncharacterized protein [Drosophila takahashii]|uniref:uncharacterized protein n=1 Tax=Drosophila takahashii TaxID=29030 RepID=UPI001CF89787|nr:keratin-associated protein 5-10 [Drosophila takahashii]XP_017002723.2 keratin-associated protein 5-10 [Drosophila takahashii]
MCHCGQFNPFYIGPYPECACGDCPYGKYSGFTRCGWSGGNGPFGTTFCDPCGGDSRYGGGGFGGGCGPCWNPFSGSSCGPSCGTSRCPPSRGSPCRADCCMMGSSGFDCAYPGQSCRPSCYPCC